LIIAKFYAEKTVMNDHIAEIKATCISLMINLGNKTNHNMITIAGRSLLSYSIVLQKSGLELLSSWNFMRHLSMPVSAASLHCTLV